MVNPQHLALAADLLDLAADKFTNHGCNDMPFPDGWSAEERSGLLRAMAADNGTPEDYDLDANYLMDWEVMGFLAGRLRDEAEEPAGPPEWMVIGAFRYALGRMTYVVGEACDWLVLNWSRLPDRAKAVIRRDLEQRFREDDAIRAMVGDRYVRPLGMDMDRSQWERVRAMWASEGGGDT